MRQLLDQIDQLAKLEPGERAAALLLLMGQTLVSAGVMVGGSLAERAHQMHAESKAGASKGVAAERPPGMAKEPSPAPKGVSAPDRFDKALIDAEMSHLGRMDVDSESRIRTDEPLRKALVDQPLAAAALKKCASPCYPPGLTDKQVQRLDRLLSRVAETGSYNESALREYLYKHRDAIDTAISQIEGTKNAGDLNAWLDFYNDPTRKIVRLPTKEDPRFLIELRDRAEKVGVDKGREMAKAAGMKEVGFENPFERRGRYGQGFDDVMMDGASLDTADIYIVEYKGGDAVLYPFLRLYFDSILQVATNNTHIS